MKFPDIPVIQPIYFDVTDIVSYAANNDRVSGIQRVHFNLIADLSRKHGGEVVRGIFLHPQTNDMVEFDPSRLFERGEFDASAFLQQLGLEPVRRFLPRPRSIKNYLRRYDANKGWRALKKLDIYISSVFMPSRLVSMGLKQQGSTPKWALPLSPLERLPEGAHYVVLTANNARLLPFSRLHRQRGGDMVQMVYDLIPHVCADLFAEERVSEFREWLGELAQQHPRVISISECTARDLRAYLGASAVGWDIQVVPLAHELDGFKRNEDVKLAEAALRRLPPSPFVLCVGTLENRKNGITLLRAWERVVGELGDAAPRLVFAGRYGWMIEEFKALLAAKPVLAGTVQVLESPGDRELAWLYGHCLFTVFPSLYEGWGLPVGEAAWFGKYSIVSSSSSLPEVCGDLADYVDPTDPAEMANMIRAAIAEPGHVAAKEAQIRQAPLRRWSDVADDVYRVVTQGPGLGANEGSQRELRGAQPE